MFYAAKKLKESPTPNSNSNSPLKEVPRPEPGRRWRKLQVSAFSTLWWVRDLIWSVLYGGTLQREVGPGIRPLERYEFDVREARSDWSSRG